MRTFDTAELSPHVAMSSDEASWIYNGLDCCVTHEIMNALDPQIDEITRTTYNRALSLQAPILEMNMAGLLVDKHAMVEEAMHMESELEKLGRIADRLFLEGYGVEVKWSSPIQLKQFFYEFLNLPVQKKRNARGLMAPTVDREALEKLSHYFQATAIVNVLLAMRDIQKELGFLRTEIDPDGFMRCNFNIAGTVTGRLASSYSAEGSGTNQQNIKRRLKRLFIARKGRKFANFDLEQADSRNVGAGCWNKFVESHGEAWAGSYLDACEAGDLHTIVTKMAWPDLPWPESPAEQRELAEQIVYREYSRRDLSKKLGHGSNYYGKPRTMAMHAKLTVSLAEDFQHNYFGAFPCIPESHKETARRLKESGSVTTILNRRRFFFGKLDDEKTLRDAIAFEGQSATADEMNEGLIALWKLSCHFPDVILRAQVHDSALIEYPEEIEDEFIPLAKKALEVPIRLKRGREFRVPVEAKTGWNWGDWSPSNPDGQKKWKGTDTRTRTIQPRTSFSFS